MSRIFCRLGFALTLVSACGQPETQHAGQDAASISAGIRENVNFFADNSTLQDVSLSDKAGFSTTVTPSALPKVGQAAVELTVVFYPRFTVPAQSKFQYDKKKWMIVVGKNNNKYVSGEDFEVNDGGGFTSGEIREGTVKMVIRLTTLPQWPESITGDAAIDVIDGRKALKILPYYSLEKDLPPGNPGTKQGLSAAYMQDDVGTIAAPAKILSSVVSDGAFSVGFEFPSDKTAVDTSTGTVTSVGQSNIGGFVVVYWKDSECAAGGWTFKPNKIFDKTKAFADLSCTYPGIDTAVAGTSSCNLGCSTDANADFFGKSALDVAAPPEIPSESGFENKIRSGCLNIVRIAAGPRSSFALNEAVNGENYGVMVYPLDSAGTIGLTRSQCIKAKPYEVGYPSIKKSPGLGKTTEDCFVATAASGSPDSLAVHYWRVLRDSWLDRIGVSAIYYRHARSWAAWLERHSQLKPAVNMVLETSGRVLVKGSQVVSRWTSSLHSAFSQLSSFVSQLWVSEARADSGVSQTENPKTAADDGLVPGSASTTLTLAASITQPSQDKDLYEASYKNKRPISGFVSQSFRVWDFFGELGLGYEIGGVMMKGKAIDEKKTDILLYGYGGGALAEYRLRITEHPWLSPRISLVGGKMRMREEASAVSTTNKETTSGTSTSGTSSSGTSTTDTSSEIKPRGTAPVWQTYTTVRGTLDLSITRLYGDDENLIRYGYGVEDLTLSLFAALHKNNGKVISTSGLQLGAGFSFFFR
jgi:hypothetical protein